MFREVSVSLITRNRPAVTGSGVRERAQRTAQQAIPAAKNAIPAARQQAGPLAKSATETVRSAGETIRQTAEDAAAWAKPHADDVAAWAKPHVEDARAWAAPRLERSGHAVQETIAPAISEAMITAARKLDVQPARRRRRWVRALAGTLILAGALSAAAAVAMRRRPVEPGFGLESGPDEMRAPADPATGPSLAEANGSDPEAELKTRPRNS
jgi:hypothetical protein